MTAHTLVHVFSTPQFAVNITTSTNIRETDLWYSSRTMVVDLRHRFIVIHMNEMTVFWPIGTANRNRCVILINNGKSVTKIYSDRPGAIVFDDN